MRSVAKATDIAEECRRRFRSRFGLDFTTQLRAEILETVDAKPADTEWRGALMFVASHRRLSFAHRPLTNQDLAVLSFLCGAKFASKQRDHTASKVLDSERSTFAKQRAKQVELDAAMAMLIDGMRQLDSPEIRRVLAWMAGQGLLTAKGPKDFKGQARDRQTARVADLWANSPFVRPRTD